MVRQHRQYSVFRPPPMLLSMHECVDSSLSLCQKKKWKSNRPVISELITSLPARLRKGPRTITTWKKLGTLQAREPRCQLNKFIGWKRGRFARSRVPTRLFSAGLCTFKALCARVRLRNVRYIFAFSCMWRAHCNPRLVQGDYTYGTEGFHFQIKKSERLLLIRPKRMRMHIHLFAE